MISLRIQKKKASSILLKWQLIIILLYIFLILITSTALAAQDEAHGIVTNVVDGDTFDVTIEKADPRITYSVERIRLSDVDSPEMNTAQGPAARDFTFAVLMNKRVYLDIDDKSGNGRDTYGRLICVAYLTGFYGQPLAMPCFNRLLVDSGHATLDNYTNNEFDPQDWWSGQDSRSMAEPLQGLKQDIQTDLLPKLQDSAEKELGRVTKEGWDWMKGQIAVRINSILKN
jgi:endonuclease YncB( thermonuclease family)